MVCGKAAEHAENAAEKQVSEMERDLEAAERTVQDTPEGEAPYRSSHGHPWPLVYRARFVRVFEATPL